MKTQHIKNLLEEIAFEPKGAWNNDPIQYRDNVIQWCQDQAKIILDELEKNETLEYKTTTKYL